MPRISLEKRIREMDADELYELMHESDTPLTADQLLLAHRQYAQITGDISLTVEED